MGRFFSQLRKNSRLSRIPYRKVSLDYNLQHRSIMAKQHSPRFLKLVESVRPHIKECSIQDLQKHLQEGKPGIVLDVREESEFAAGHVPGARHLGKGIIERDIESVVPETGTKVLLYCGGGFRSALVAETLQKMGYTDVISVDGGWRAWNEAGLPTSR
jgi:rhodanese-related sulfurtransferase